MQDTSGSSYTYWNTLTALFLMCNTIQMQVSLHCPFGLERQDPALRSLIEAAVQILLHSHPLMRGQRMHEHLVLAPGAKPASRVHDCDQANF